MDTEHSLKRPEINLDLQLDPSIASALDLHALQESMRKELRELLRMLGIPGVPRTQITSAQGSSHSADGFLHATVNGQPCRYAAETLLRAYNYLTDNVLDGIPIRSCVLQALTEQPAEQISAFVCLVCTEAIKRSPAALLTIESALTYRTALSNGADEASLRDALGLQSLLVSVLNLGISIADSDRVAQILMEGFTEERSPSEIAEDLIVGLRPDVVEVQIPRDYLEEITLNIPESDRGNFAMMRDGLFYELGMRFPAIRFVPTENLQRNSVRIRINHLPMLPFRGLHADECLVNDTPDRLKLLNIDGRAAINPANLSLCSVIHTKDADLAQKAGLTTWNQLGYLILAISAELRTHAACFLDRRVVETFLSDLEWSYQQLVEAARVRVSPEAMTQSLRLLLAEQISIRNMRQILQSMIEFHFDDSKLDILDPDLIERNPPSAEWMNDPANLTSFLRAKMKRYIGHKYKRGSSSLVVFLLDQEIEALLSGHQAIATGARLAELEPHDRDSIVSAIGSEFDALPTASQAPVVLTTSTVRPVLRELVAPEFPRVAVICYHELEPDTEIQPIARISLDA